jgi:hypothetical protein
MKMKLKIYKKEEKLKGLRLVRVLGGKITLIHSGAKILKAIKIYKL